MVRWIKNKKTLYAKGYILNIKAVGIGSVVWLLMQDKIKIESRTITKDKEGHFLMIKMSIHEEDITITNVYVPNNRALKQEKSKELKKETE